MRSLKKLFAPICAAAMWTVGVLAAPDLKIGDPAPSFALQGSDGRIHTLGEYKGKQTIVIAWFAKAFTGG